jgi:xanthine dehydrogenase large subunit
LAVLTAADIPGDRWIGPIAHDEPVLADAEIDYAGQPVALVLGETEALCRRGAALVRLEIEPLPAILDIDQALQAGAFFGEPHILHRGDPERALAAAAVRIDGEVRTPPQDHFYLETHAALVEPREHGSWFVRSSTQHPSEVQHMVARVLGVGRHRVDCAVPRMGGAFGGKESQANLFACLAAIGSFHLRRPVKLVINRHEDMALTGKRHPMLARYRVGFDADGRFSAFVVDLFADGGFSLDLSPAILSRALFHLDNAYFIPDLHFTGRICRTNHPSNTAFRGFGGPQGMVVVEDAINRFAEAQGVDPAKLRERNYYQAAIRNRAPYGMVVPAPRLHRIHRELSRSADYGGRLQEIEVFNRVNPHRKRGLGLQPVKFGISFTNSILNQAGALVHLYTDGTAQVNHGGTEMGQGLHTKMRAIAAAELGLSLAAVRIMETATDKVPNTSATAASSGSDLNGQAVAAACRTLRQRLTPLARRLLRLPAGTPLHFSEGVVRSAAKETVQKQRLTMAELTQAAWVERVSLSVTGYYSTPGIHYDAQTGRGAPFFYFAYGAALVEVEVDLFTGEHALRRVEILHDVGNSLLPSIDRGQIEGGFLQGVGWLTREEFLYRDDGAPLTCGPSTYKIPSAGDAPQELRIELLDRAAQPGVIKGSKAVGEPPFMLALGVVTALRQALYASLPEGEHRTVPLQLPATPEAVLRALWKLRRQ